MRILYKAIFFSQRFQNVFAVLISCDTDYKQGDEIRDVMSSYKVTIDVILNVYLLCN